MNKRKKYEPDNMDYVVNFFLACLRNNYENSMYFS